MPIHKFSWSENAKVTIIFKQRLLFERLLFVLNNCKFFILKEVLQIKVHLVLSQIHFLHHTVYK